METRKFAGFAERREFALKILEDLPIPSHYCRSRDSKKYIEYLFGSLTKVFSAYQKEAEKL
jgi:hypothetical protein